MVFKKNSKFSLLPLFFIKKVVYEVTIPKYMHVCLCMIFEKHFQKNTSVIVGKHLLNNMNVGKQETVDPLRNRIFSTLRVHAAILTYIV